MADIPLVMGLIEPGRRLLDRVSAEGVQVTAALWAFREGGDQPYLCIVTPQANSTDTRPLYGVVNRLLAALDADGLQTVDWASVMFLPSNRPPLIWIGDAVASVRPPGRWHAPDELGVGGLSSVFIYPAISAPTFAPAA